MAAKQTQINAAPKMGFAVEPPEALQGETAWWLSQAIWNKQIMGSYGGNLWALFDIHLLLGGFNSTQIDPNISVN